MIEKENKKERLIEKKKYMKTIKELISFVRKRDPRWKEHQALQAQKEEQRLAERKQKFLDEKRAKEGNRQAKIDAELER